MKDEHYAIEELKRRIGVLWDAIEQIRQALPRCTECDSLLNTYNISSYIFGSSIGGGREFCSDACHQVANHT